VHDEIGEDSRAAPGIVLPFVGAPIIPGPRKYTAGLVQGPHCPVYITRGIGYAGVPLRIHRPLELALMSLQQT
jgi:predicted MPP superfamily phosphohydrolase